MKIIQLKAENVKRLKAVEISPDGNLVIVGGNNGEGKTSLLDSIPIAIGGRWQTPADPVRHGEKAAEIELVFDEDFVLYKKLNPDGSTEALELTSKSGVAYQSPQKLLDSFCSKFSFDPLAFLDYEPKKQLQLVRDLAGINTDLLDKDIKEKEESVKGLKIEFDALSNNLSNKYRLLPEHQLETLETSQLEEQLAESTRIATAKNSAMHEYNAARANLTRCDTELAELKARYEALVAQRQEFYQKATQAHTAYMSLPEAPDTATIREQIARASEQNVQVELQRQREEDLEILKETQEKLEAAKTGLLAIREEKEALIRNAKLPVDKLELTDDGIKYNGVPFEQCSSAEQLRVSTAMGMALNPRLRILLIRDGSLLDANSLKMIADMAAENDFQIWMERVGEGEECSVIIENGIVQSSKGH